MNKLLISLFVPFCIIIGILIWKLATILGIDSDFASFLGVISCGGVLLVGCYYASKLND